VRVLAATEVEDQLPSPTLRWLLLHPDALAAAEVVSPTLLLKLKSEKNCCCGGARYAVGGVWEASAPDVHAAQSLTLHFHRH
jgi:hypothetical protein